MPVFYCQNCGAKQTYSGKKPETCLKCKKGFEVVAHSPIVSKTPSSPTPSKPRDPRLERRRELLAERRGSPISQIIDEDEEFDEYEDDTSFDIPRPRKLKVSIEASNGSVGPLGGVLKNANPKMWKDL
jgi:hypothetical protein